MEVSCDGDNSSITSKDNNMTNNNTNNNNNSNNNKVTGIWELKKHCSNRKLEFPCYKIIETTDYANNKLFTVRCSIGHRVETGTGKKKKEAKHKASRLLLERFKQEAEMNGDMEDSESLEEGEINDLEEGEIVDDDDKMIVTSINNSDLKDDILPADARKYKSFKIYMEGNFSKANTMIYNTVDNNGKKSQVDNLAEFCFEQKLPSPRYEINEHNGLRSLIFTCRCSVLQLTIRTSGPNKDSVKERASALLLSKMRRHIDILRTNNETIDLKKEFDLEEGEIVDEDDIRHNKRCLPPIQRKAKRMKMNQELTGRVNNDLGMGDLYNHCLKMKIPPPIYTMLSKRNISATKTIFTFQCSVLKLMKIGNGLTKKYAKHHAAKLVLEKLQNNGRNEVNEDNEDELLEEGELTEKDEQVKKEYIKHKLANNFISHEEKNRLQLQGIMDRHNLMKTDKTYCDMKILKKLKEMDDDHIKRRAITLLEQLCKETESTHSFVDFKSQSSYKTAVFINCSPSWSTFGEGETKMEAQFDAIVKLLNFFKEMSS